jgi:hypothetical protein
VPYQQEKRENRLNTSFTKPQVLSNFIHKQLFVPKEGLIKANNTSITNAYNSRISRKTIFRLSQESTVLTLTIIYNPKLGTPHENPL